MAIGPRWAHEKKQQKNFKTFFSEANWLVTLKLDILRTARKFWNCCKNGSEGEHLALECYLIHSSIIYSMKTIVDLNCFFRNSVFLIGPKNDDCAEEKPARGFYFCFILFFFYLFIYLFIYFFCNLIPDFPPPFLLLFLSSFFSSIPRIFCIYPFRSRSVGLDLATLPRQGWIKAILKTKI